MALIVPEVGAQGAFTFLPPFNAASLTNEVYTCKSVRTISDFIASGVDVLSLAYLDYGLSDANYAADYAADMQIVSLQGGMGHWLYVPVSYLAAFPMPDGVLYHNMALSVSLGPMPVGFDFSAVQAEISNLIKDSLGITSSMVPVEISRTVMLTATQDATMRAARAVSITTPQTDRANLIIMTQNYQTALTQLKALEQYILANASKLGI